jgi:peptide/nickel transport system permease protein
VAKEQTHKDTVWHRFRQSRVALAALGIVGVWLFVALFASFLASPLPYRCDFRGERLYPFFQQEKILAGTDSVLREFNWRELPIENAWWTPIPYGPDKNRPHALFSPFGAQIPKGESTALAVRFRHWLGTDRSGRDVWAMLIHGSRTSLLVALLGMGIATFLGLLIGSLTGFLGDQPGRQSRGLWLGGLLGLVPAWFYAYQVRYYAFVDAQDKAGLILEVVFSILLFFLILGLFVFLGKQLHRWSWFRKPLNIPLDLMLSRLIEILDSLPVMMLIVSLAALLGRNIWLVVLAIGLVGWTGIARLIRAEMLRIRNMPYIEAARGLGLPQKRIIWRHALPNALPPVLISLVLSFAGLILLEAGLGFLGLIQDRVSWGSLLVNAREDGFSYWWVIVCPGLIIFLVVLSINLVGERLRDVFDPRTIG